MCSAAESLLMYRLGSDELLIPNLYRFLRLFAMKNRVREKEYL